LFFCTQRLEGGLFNLQQVSLIIAFACVMDSNGGDSGSGSAKRLTMTCLEKVQRRLEAEGSSSLGTVLDVLRDMAVTLRAAADSDRDRESAEAAGAATGSSAGGAAVAVAVTATQLQRAADRELIARLTEWCAALDAIIGPGDEEDT
jgi:hypothetical protein